ncbi:MAG: hypothetical protein PF693_18865 [Spirochaetia bacterium]|nr:hypothetical protein [Spirochaetia bacterium]
MNTKIKNIYYLVPIFFLFVTGFLLFLEFSDRDNFFNIQIDKIRLSGTGEQGLDKNSLSNVKLTLPGLALNFSKEPITFRTKEGTISSANITGFVSTESGFTLSFTNSLIININTNDSTSIVFDISYRADSTDTAGSIVLSVEFMSDLHQVSFLPCFSYTVSGANYMIAARSGSIFDMTAGSLMLPLTNNSASIVIDEIGDKDPLQYYFFGEQAPVSTDLYESTVENFISTAYEGWRVGRFNSENGDWALAEGTNGFDNYLLTSFISESLKRGRLAQIGNIVDTVNSREDEFNFLSATFSGNIVNTNSSRIIIDDTLKKRISTAVKSEDITLFLESNLMEELSWISSSALFRDFSKFVSSLDLGKRYVPAVLTGMVEVYMASIKIENDQYKDLMRLFSVIEEQIFPSLTRVNNGLFISGGKESLFDTSLTIRTGIALYEIGKIESNNLFETIGKSMIVSVLSLADESGMIPEFIDRESEIHGKGYFGADTLYPKLISNKYYPHVVNFKGTAGTDISVWTAANTVSHISTKNSSVFEFTYPLSGVHHVVIKGIEPFTNLQMNGINWNSDKRFQYYSSGWVYEREEKTLYIKQTQKRTKEKIVLNYREATVVNTDTAGE